MIKWILTISLCVYCPLHLLNEGQHDTLYPSVNSGPYKFTRKKMCINGQIGWFTITVFGWGFDDVSDRKDPFPLPVKQSPTNSYLTKQPWSERKWNGNDSYPLSRLKCPYHLFSVENSVSPLSNQAQQGIWMLFTWTQLSRLQYPPTKFNIKSTSTHDTNQMCTLAEREWLPRSPLQFICAKRSLLSNAQITQRETKNSAWKAIN